jgi:hypothetical protein
LFNVYEDETAIQSLKSFLFAEYLNLTTQELSTLCPVEAVYAVLQAVGITASNDNPFYTSIRILMEQHYGVTKTEIILWWVFESITEDGGILPLVDENGKTHIIKTPTQLYKFIKKYE